MAKKKARSGSVNVDAVKREVKKTLAAAEANPPKKSRVPDGYTEALPGTVQRQSPLEQEMGTGKYREMIHNHNDKNKHILDRLPFTFPRKKVARGHRSVAVECPTPKCENWIYGNEFMIGAVCSKCKKYVRLENPDAVEMGYDPEINIGYRGSLADKIDAKSKKKDDPA